MPPNADRKSIFIIVSSRLKPWPAAMAIHDILPAMAGVRRVASKLMRLDFIVMSGSGIFIFERSRVCSFCRLPIRAGCRMAADYPYRLR
jgi:hypothetical protein